MIVNTQNSLANNHFLNRFNDTDSPYSYDKTVVQLFEECAAKSPESIAIYANNAKLTYRELSDKSNQLAWLLRKKGVKPNSIVALVTERSFEMIIGIFAIWKAGGAYMPIEPTSPDSLKRRMFYDSQCDLLLAQETFVNQQGFRGEVIDLNSFDRSETRTDPLPQINAPHDLAYIIYTSGSTGHPKGVLIEHHSLTNRIEWMQKKYPIKLGDVLFQKTTYIFDVSVWELVWWAIAGATVCLLPPNKEHDPRAFVKAIEKHQVTVVHFVPSVLRLFLEYIGSRFDLKRIKSLRYVFVSGEALNISLLKEFYKIFPSNYPTKLINLYGPTEATIDVSFFDCPRNHKGIVPIGKPIDNTGFYIFDENLKLCPIGQTGDLYVFGVNLSRGYLNRPLLTAERFVSDPLVPGSIMYKTGDMAKWLPDGNIVFQGRSDGQVKVRGLRIELGEIEYHLLNHPIVKAASVLVRKDKVDNAYLCAYVMAPDCDKGSKDSIIQHLTTNLPAYMVPSQILFLDEFPLKSNGKVDTSSLPNPYQEETFSCSNTKR